MRSYLTKKLPFCMALCIMALIVFYTLMSVSAYEIACAEEGTVLYETESNNTYATANVLSLNTGIRGNLSSQSDEDWYKFTTVSAGVFNVSFEHTLFQSGSNFWHIYLYDSTGTNTISGSDDYFSSYGSANAVSNNYGVPAGTYYVRVTKASYTFYRDYGYTVTVNFTPGNNHETENNDTKEKANLILINKTYTGALTTNGDEDWYKFTPSVSGTSYITFQHEYYHGGSNFWRIYIYNSNGSALAGSASGIGVSGNVPRTTDKFSVKDETYYVRITRNTNVFYSPVDYQLTVYFSCEQHNYSDEIIKTAPTCVKPGTETKTCVICGYIYQADSSPALGHSGDWSVLSQPTCVETGKEICTCDVCGEIHETRNISALGHEGEWVEVRASTCNVAGKEDLVCNVCNEVYDSRSLPLTNHTYEVEQIKKPSVVAAGENKFSCSICGDTYSESDKSLLWVLPTVVGVAVVVAIGIINYVRVVKKHKR